LTAYLTKSWNFKKGEQDLMYIKAEELGLKENHGIQKTGIEDFYGNITVHQRQVMKIWENYITELYD
jgi:hypothetical protein